MRFNLWRNVSEIHREWNAQYFVSLNKKHYDPMFLYGEKASGKTSVALEYVRKYPGNSKYFSFARLNGKQARQSFCDVFDLDPKDSGSWDQIGRSFKKKYNGRSLLIFYDDFEDFEDYDEFTAASAEYIEHGRIIPCWITHKDLDHRYEYHTSQISINIEYRTLSEIYKILPDYSRADVLRLFTLTSGILPILEELNEKEPFESNIRRLLAYDSAFSMLLPQWLCEHFRTPESYYPILSSIADGKHHLSEIARDVGYPNNKCLTYIKALIEARLVSESFLEEKRGATYDLTHTYIAAWCRYVYKNRSLQISDLDALEKKVYEDIDTGLSLQSFRNACFRYLQFSGKDYIKKTSFQYKPRILRNTKVRLDNGEYVVFAYCSISPDLSLYTVMPDNINTRYTIEDLARFREAVRIMPGGYDNFLLIFSVNRFSDRIVHEASIDNELYLVTLERLKY